MATMENEHCVKVSFSCWLGCCPWGYDWVPDYQWDNVDCAKKANLEWYESTLWNFATVHSAYHEHMEFSAFPTNLILGP